MSAELQEKREVINFLLSDFNKMFPESNRQTQVEVHSRLSLMTLEDLRLLKGDLETEISQGK
jgi:hypothetical protein